jgi:excisionase family DNA binding protein
MNANQIPEAGAGQPREPEFLNKDGVAAMLNISRRSVDNMLARGELPHIRLSKRCIRFPKGAVLDALAARTVGTR